MTDRNYHFCCGFYMATRQGPTWDNLGPTLWQFWDKFDTTFWKFWDYFLTVLVQLFDSLGQLWDNFVTVSALLCDSFGTTLWQFWTTLWQFWDSLGRVSSVNSVSSLKRFGTSISNGIFFFFCRYFCAYLFCMFYFLSNLPVLLLFFHPFCLFSFFLFFFISFACFQRCHSGCQLVTLCCPVKDRRRAHHNHFNSLARRTHKGDDYEGDEDQGSKNCSILPSRMGEYGEHVEHREHGKYGKHQPDD